MGRTEIDDVGARIDVATIQPLHDKVLVKLFDREKTASGSLYIKGTGTTSAVFGEVVAMGEGIENPIDPTNPFPFGFEPGDYVVKMRYSGDDLNLRIGPYSLVREHGIWARVKFKGDPATYNLASVEPRMNCVLVKMKQDPKSPGGILLPGGKDSKARCCKAIVVKVSPGRWHAEAPEDCWQCGEGQHRIPLGVEPGDEVIVHQYAGEDMEIDGEVFRLLQEGDIEGIWHE
jgi:co-chaperonin GroES (HSP10)